MVRGKIPSLELGSLPGTGITLTVPLEAGSLAFLVLKFLGTLFLTLVASKLEYIV